MVNIRAPKFTGSNLHEAVRNGKLDLVREILEYNPTLIEYEGSQGQTALIIAAEDGKSEIVDYLISKNANLEARGKNGDTALIATNYPQIMESLLKAGANVNAQGYGKETALINSVQNININAITVLLAFNADVSIIDGKGKTAIDYAEAAVQKKWSHQPNQEIAKRCKDSIVAKQMNGRASLDMDKSFPRGVAVAASLTTLAQVLT